MEHYNKSFSFFASCGKGLESVLVNELKSFGTAVVETTKAGARFEGNLELAYRACLWSRVASRILLPIASFPANNPEELYAGIRTIPWYEHFSPSGTLAVDCVGIKSPISHTHFAALKVKDAIVDQMRERTGMRPNIDLSQPDLRVNVLLKGSEATARIDLSGESLHRRHYRQCGGHAPLKENLAAGLLLLADWPNLARQNRPLMDLMCGSGTFLIEAALMAADIAPGLCREHFGFLHWAGHEPAVWMALREEAQERAAAGQKNNPLIVGYDENPAAIRTAIANIKQAKLENLIRVERKELNDCYPLAVESLQDSLPKGIVIVNPPYGERLGDETGLIPLYIRLGDLFKQRFAGWDAYVLAGNSGLTKYIGLRPAKRYPCFNGPIECRLLHYPLVAGKLQPAQTLVNNETPSKPEAVSETVDKQDPIQMFINRLKKNLKQLGRWARREGIQCYRLYDADLPEYAVAIDRYEQWVHIQEYAPPKTVDPMAAHRRLRQILSVTPDVIGVSPANVFFKVRKPQKHKEQYQKLQSIGELKEVSEGAYRFLVNFTDYLDTGLFLDHRSTRVLIGQLAKGRKFLNLFCYTGTATVYAAKGGASATTSVDLSHTYLEWAQKNLTLNRISGPRHQLVRADCLEWLKTEKGRYGLIFLDPPTFSNSKAMHSSFDIERDQVWLLKHTARLLTPDGILIFSTNARRFKLDLPRLEGLSIENISRQTLPPDFARNPRIHQTWKILRR